MWWALSKAVRTIQGKAEKCLTLPFHRNKQDQRHVEWPKDVIVARWRQESFSSHRLARRICVEIPQSSSFMLGPTGDPRVSRQQEQSHYPPGQHRDSALGLLPTRSSHNVPTYGRGAEAQGVTSLLRMHLGCSRVEFRGCWAAEPRPAPSGRCSDNSLPQRYYQRARFSAIKVEK